ncbi:MAG: bifunctional methylenetetrahydrofolate dehydrogenase/methenyltetrahydrofolate cyclohydrolase FolD [Euryarchaeota archaeon]|jgi:methylenetetrahydrofolate dehydrogenase (NADP+)/methenyltetrahydrofolate cyclohydrolase|nr:bifunctional methylenetetrahydrofolate dehydrogenase/methenyltetrahydrofolate cyclohydrolase FolD [Euryarchaeota archaeon]MBT4981976.1 bifunctional methylenetetrahydrofolate dehydrogenase/methenyltetrahydrofolate cyclohydrolase FolD [Euryarchaeota archaeon]MBT5184251.1 bifunctional methylenetetrahydrofolate dehydrogenase/methenyltetrahydrofolate cyclohydrolase FolD [Euryarchaeota archaeon]
MAAIRLDGKACAADLEERLKQRIVNCTIQPHLAVVIVGNDPASHVYVRNKIKSCERLGIKSSHIELPAETSQDEVVKTILALNGDDSLHGILIQSPLPSHMDEESLTDLIDPKKDVDGFHPVNLGRIVQGRLDGMIPCTPAGVMEMLRWSKVEMSGKKAVVIGRSFNVGMPQALLLAAKGADATVTIVHSRTKDAKAECLTADIVIAAVGRPEMVTSDWIKPGAVVVDVGINRIDDSTRERGWRLAGDVHPDVAEVASLLSPVPGGVGPMTVAMLMANTVTATEGQHS